MSGAADERSAGASDQPLEQRGERPQLPIEARELTCGARSWDGHVCTLKKTTHEREGDPHAHEELTDRGVWKWNGVGRATFDDYDKDKTIADLRAELATLKEQRCEHVWSNVTPNVGEQRCTWCGAQRSEHPPSPRAIEPSAPVPADVLAYLDAMAERWVFRETKETIEESKEDDIASCARLLREAWNNGFGHGLASQSALRSRLLAWLRSERFKCDRSNVTIYAAAFHIADLIEAGVADAEAAGEMRRGAELARRVEAAQRSSPLSPDRTYSPPLEKGSRAVHIPTGHVVTLVDRESPATGGGERWSVEGETGGVCLASNLVAIREPPRVGPVGTISRPGEADVHVATANASGVIEHGLSGKRWTFSICRGDTDRTVGRNVLAALSAAVESRTPAAVQVKWEQGDRCRVSKPGLIGPHLGELAIVESVGLSGPLPICIRFSDGRTRLVTSKEIAPVLSDVSTLGPDDLLRRRTELEKQAGDLVSGALEDAQAAASRLRLASGALRAAVHSGEELIKRLRSFTVKP